MGCTRSPFSGGLQCCAFCTGPVNPDVIRLQAQVANRNLMRRLNLSVAKQNAEARMDESWLAESYSHNSKRHAMLIHDNNSAWLYLYSPSEDATRSGEVVSTAFAFNLIPPISETSVQEYRDGPPPIPISYATAHALIIDPSTHEWGIAWSADGECALATRDGKPWCFTSPEHGYGFCKAVSSDGPWGNSWDNEAFNAVQWGKV